MMSTTLAERQESNGIGQRGQGSQSYPPVGGVRRTLMFRKTATDSLSRDRRIGDERYRRGAVDDWVQSDGLGTCRPPIRRGDWKNSAGASLSAIRNRCGGGSGGSHLLRRVGSEPRGRGGQDEADSRDSSGRDVSGADATEIRGCHLPALTEKPRRRRWWPMCWRRWVERRW